MIDLNTLHRRARRVLPAQIQTDAVVVDTMDESCLAAWLLPLSHQRRGCLVFRLAAPTIASLASRAMPYLQEARRAREGLGRLMRPMVYRPWSRHGAGPSQRFATCSEDGRASLCLLPAAGAALYAWNDRGLPETGPHAT